jgi:MFS transporter, putative metabolite:H+ symporter
LFFYYGLFILFVAIYFFQSGGSHDRKYWICAGLGLATGFWAMFITIAAEQFGTNLRATAATTITNMVRDMLPLIILLFKLLLSYVNYVTVGIIIGIMDMLVTVISALFIQETFI